MPEQDAAARFRFGHYLRRYHVQECDGRQLHVAAEWLAALLAAGLPVQAAAPPAAGAHRACPPTLWLSVALNSRWLGCLSL